MTVHCPALPKSPRAHIFKLPRPTQKSSANTLVGPYSGITPQVPHHRPRVLAVGPPGNRGQYLGGVALKPLHCYNTTSSGQGMLHMSNWSLGTTPTQNLLSTTPTPLATQHPVNNPHTSCNIPSKQPRTPPATESPHADGLQGLLFSFTATLSLFHPQAPTSSQLLVRAAYCSSRCLQECESLKLQLRLAT